MIIKGTNGTRTEGIILSVRDNSMRVGLRGSDDVVEFTCIRGQWVSEHCEPVEVEYAWQQQSQKPTVSEADCICSKELATQLIDLLNSEEEELPGVAPINRSTAGRPV